MANRTMNRTMVDGALKRLRFASVLERREVRVKTWSEVTKSQDGHSPMISHASVSELVRNRG